MTINLGAFVAFLSAHKALLAALFFAGYQAASGQIPAAIATALAALSGGFKPPTKAAP